jgi:hypothetical protein
MTTFTSEDRISSAQYFTDPGINDEGFFIRKPWPENPWFTAKDYRQTEIEFFFPLTEQIPLGLDYTGCEKPKISVTTINPVTFSVSNATWSTNISPTLSVKPQNSVGQLNIGGIQIGLEKQPKWHQKVLYKLLGFNWKDR